MRKQIFGSFEFLPKTTFATDRFVDDLSAGNRSVLRTTPMWPKMQRFNKPFVFAATFVVSMCLSTDFPVVHALAFRPPPNIRLALGQEEALKRDCQQVTNESKDGDSRCFTWAPGITCCDYKLATMLFQHLATSNTQSINMWLPRFSDDGSSKKKLARLVQVLNDNSHRFGNVEVESNSWPKTPAAQVCINMHPPSALAREQTSCTQNADAIQDTEQWVLEKLCGMGLCPYTASMTRAAVGLDSVGVAEGPIVIRHSEDASKAAITASDAAILSDAFWKGVTDLATLKEVEVATFLIVAPTSMDDDFVEFAAVFDELIEPSVQAVGAETIVGRALFHPRYNSTVIGHNKILTGHALPAKMVQGFVDQYGPSFNLAKSEVPDLNAIALANDAVRWTPHATINLLRRSQLTAAKDAEAFSATKRPNWIYAKNVFRMLQSESSES